MTNSNNESDRKTLKMIKQIPQYGKQRIILVDTVKKIYAPYFYIYTLQYDRDQY